MGPPASPDPRRRGRALLQGAVACWIAAGCGTALARTPRPHAAPPAPSLNDAERQRDADAQAQARAAVQAQQAALEERRRAEASVAGASKLRGTETTLAEALARVDVLKARQATAEAALQAMAGRLAPMLPLIERLSAYPAETLLAVPLAPNDAIQGLLVLRGIAASLQAEAAQLREEQQTVARLKAQVDAALPALRAAEQAQSAGAAQLDQQLAASRAQRARLDDAASDSVRRAAASAAQAESVRSMLAQMASDRKAAEARAAADAAAATRQRRTADAAAARQKTADLERPAGPGVSENQLVVPVAGTIVRAWGEPSDDGTTNGVSYQTPPGARVVSPCTGRVAFAGAFRSFGQLLIVDCGGGFHAVLAGFDRLDAAVGRPVLTGEPVGVMPDGRPKLYVELRRGGQPVNPAPYLKGRSNPSAS